MPTRKLFYRNASLSTLDFSLQPVGESGKIQFLAGTNRSGVGWNRQGVHLRHHGLVLTELSESLTIFRQALQQRSGLPKFAVLVVEVADTFVNVLQPDRVGIPHRSASIRGEPVPVQINDVDVDGAQGNTFLKNTRSLIYESVDRTFDDLVGRHIALGDAGFTRPLLYQVLDFRIRNRASAFIVLVPPGTSFLPIATEFAKAILGKRLTHPELLQMPVLLADPPTHIETCQVARGHRSHGHAEIIQRSVDRSDAGPFLGQELRFPAVRTEHAVSDEPATVSHQHANFAQFLRHLQAGGDYCLTARPAANNFKQPHHVCRAEKMSPNHRFGPGCG